MVDCRSNEALLLLAQFAFGRMFLPRIPNTGTPQGISVFTNNKRRLLAPSVIRGISEGNMDTPSGEPVNDELHEPVKEILVLLKKQNDHDAAVAKIIGFRGKKPATRYTLIQVLLSTGQHYKDRELIQCALDAFDKVKAKAPNDSALYYDIATCYQELYDLRRRSDGANIFDCEDLIKQSLKYAQKASASDPRVLTNLGNLYDTVGRPVDAIDCYDRALRRDESFGMAMGNKAMVVEALAPITSYSTTYMIYAHQLYQSALTHQQG